MENTFAIAVVKYICFEFFFGVTNHCDISVLCIMYKDEFLLHVMRHGFSVTSC